MIDNTKEIGFIVALGLLFLIPELALVAAMVGLIIGSLLWLSMNIPFNFFTGRELRATIRSDVQYVPTRKPSLALSRQQILDLGYVRFTDVDGTLRWATPEYIAEHATTPKMGPVQDARPRSDDLAE